MPAITKGKSRLKLQFVANHEHSICGGLVAVEAMAERFGLWDKLRKLEWLDPRKERRLTVVGSRPMAELDDTQPAEMLRIYDKGFDRPPESALAASVFLFSSALYGGFFNFAIGGLAFALWAGELERDERGPVQASAGGNLSAISGRLAHI